MPLSIPEGTDLFPTSVYGWLNQSDQPSCDISHVLTEAVKHGAEDWCVLFHLHCSFLMFHFDLILNYFLI